MRWAILSAALVGLLGCGGKADPKPADAQGVPPAGDGKGGEKVADAAAKNRDYFEVLETQYLYRAMLAAGGFWNKTGGSKEWPSLGVLLTVEGNAAFELVRDAFNAEADKVERDITAKRRVFVNKHGMDSKEWGNEFKKQFPERDIIYDEIEPDTHNLERKQADRLSSHLAPRKAKMAEDEFIAYRGTYLKREVPTLIAEVRAATLKTESIAKMRAAVKTAR